MIKTDIIIIGAGPTGLFTVFEAGLLGLKCHIIDSLAKPGGQCSEIYPNKPIYDIPAYPEIMAGDLIDKLLDQIKPFDPGYTMGESAVELKKSDGEFIITTDKNTNIKGKVVAIAGGLGNFEPRKPNIENIDKYEENGLVYKIINKDNFKDKNVIISGGGDSALDWTLELSKIAKKVTLIHRRNEFRGAVESVKQIQKLKDKNIVDVITPAQLVAINGNEKVESIDLKVNEEVVTIETDYIIPLYGLIPKMNIFKEWGLNIEKNAISVNNALDYSTNIKGIYAIGDINYYPGKLKLILSGFHEAAVMCHSAYNYINPDKKNILKYTTVSGIKGFDGSVKQPKKSTINSIN
ncbi:MAG: ferredoxin--NADP(+) reductase [Flavobacteriaceae bacterium]|nr:ferredoxin--NADP(+) reductase [Flavobacteriaceae bacterium]|tara:strand:+ start:622 stop:1671 length:1050 start_codon:yes stop_codon:yes gene_type:complete